MNRDLIDQLLDVARQVAPEIEAAVAGVKDAQLRSVIASAIMRSVLEEVRAGKKENLAGADYTGKITDISEEGKTSGTQGRILDLRADGFFAEPRRLEQVLEELRIKGYHHNKSDVRMSLLRLARRKSLRRIPFGTGRQRTFLYVNL